MGEQNVEVFVEEVALEEGKRVGDVPYFIDYGYTQKTWSIRLELDRLSNTMWKETGYVFNTEED